MLRFDEMMDRLRAAVYARLSKQDAQDIPLSLSVALGADTVLGGKIRAIVLVADSAGQTRQLIRTKGHRSIGEQVMFHAGPHVDGTTANTGRIFLGQQSVNPANGWQLNAGEQVGCGAAIDLASVWVHFTAADDVLRVLYFTP